tara:strand:- start:57638 stop:58510 length:873 start_codon:yes stop_codon:yes gene_type:complete
MSSILVATDFSTRSDRALRRAVLTARQIKANLVLFHALDDDLPDPLLAIHRDASEALLAELADTIVNTDQIKCSYRLALGDPFRALIEAACDMKPEIVMIGSHRRNLLKDIFVGTTAERSLRESPRPMIMANGVPAGPYRRILIATDCSDQSVSAAMAAKELGLLEHASVTVLHAFDTPEQGMMQRSLMSGDEIDDYVVSMRAQATSNMQAFLNRADIKPNKKQIKPVEVSTTETILGAVQQGQSDLLVIGTHGRSGVEKLFLGSVAEEILRRAEVDVLAVPPLLTAASG